MTDQRHDELRGAHLADESLTPTERLELRSLLASDLEAAQELAELRSLASALRADPSLLGDLREHLEEPTGVAASSTELGGAHAAVPISSVRNRSSTWRGWVTTLAGAAAGLAIVASVVSQRHFDPMPASRLPVNSSSTSPSTKSWEAIPTRAYLMDYTGVIVELSTYPDGANRIMRVKFGGPVPSAGTYQVALIYSLGQSESFNFGDVQTLDKIQATSFESDGYYSPDRKVWLAESEMRRLDVLKFQKFPIAGLFTIPISSTQPDGLLIRTMGPEGGTLRFSLIGIDKPSAVWHLPSSPVSSLTGLTSGPTTRAK